jgi:hypothetical protein
MLSALRGEGEKQMEKAAGEAAGGILSNPAAILGFGFIGLAFLMAFMGYRALTEVIQAPNPRPNVVGLARLYLFISLALLVLAGPLHFGLLWAQDKFSRPPVNVTISLLTSTWPVKKYGDVGIWEDGHFRSISAEALKKKVAEGGEINLQLDKVQQAVGQLEEQYRAQLLSVSQASAVTSSGVIPAPPAADPANVSLSGG